MLKLLGQSSQSLLLIPLEETWKTMFTSARTLYETLRQIKLFINMKCYFTIRVVNFFISAVLFSNLKLNRF